MDDSSESGSRTRTRRAIVAAAIEVLGRNSAAPLGEIATAAQVGRTTLHRYFPERSDLLAAVVTEGLARLSRAGERARLDRGTGAEAFLRLCTEYFELGDLLSLIFTEAEFTEDPAWSDDELDREFFAMVARGHADGTLDPALPVEWLQSLLWSQLYAAWSYLNEHDATRHEVLVLLTNTLTKAVAPPPG
ncbi:TetR/AcrR family transcriptional regulator [Micromonospora sp. SH-82]|uniref:TetR/AcrR family transcriptional regulator n=1 Tax=Micromonospora sp. SH-82 TaxID=3132938 RepID=UPI003EBBE49F